MKTTLNQPLVLSLEIGSKPTKIEDGKIVGSVPNPTHTPYILFDDHQKAPTGFGVKVAGKTTYVIQKKVQGKVIKVKVGNLSDYNLVDAREAARRLVQKMIETGRNPNTLAREQELQEITLGDCFDRYLSYLNSPPEVATDNTLSAFNKASKKLEKWKSVKVRELTSDQILKRFDEIFAKTPTTAEQTFRWAHASVERVLEREKFEAEKAQRQPLLSTNPFQVLKLEKKYRTRKQLEDAYEEKGVRKPLLTRDVKEVNGEKRNSLGLFFDAVFERRKENRTGCDYILCCLLWGTRKSEAAELQWRKFLTEAESKVNSWVDLEQRRVFFFDTKTRINHELPISDAVYEILKQREDLIQEQHESKQQWVFPARSKFSKTGHYTDGRSLLKYICEDANIPRRAPHDFRRTFSTVAEELCSWGMLKRLIGHSDRSDATGRYPEMEWLRIVDDLQRVELHLLKTSPTVYNAFLTPKYPLI